MRKFIVPIALTVAILFQAIITFANPNSVTPPQVLPQKLDMVVNVDLKQSPIITNLVESLMQNEEETAKAFIKIATKNNVIIGARGMEKEDAEQDFFLAVQVTGEQFETISKEFGAHDGLVKRGDIISYLCTKNLDNCFAKLGKYFYLTNAPKNMDEMVINFKNGGLDVLDQNKKYVDSQSMTVFRPAFDMFLDFKFLRKAIETELENSSYSEYYGADKELTDLLGKLMMSLDYEGVSLSVSDKNLTGNMYLKHNAEIRKLPFSYMDFVSKPNLYNYVSADNLMFYSESNNLGKRMDFIDGLMVNEFGEEATAILGLGKLLDGRTAFAVRYDTNDSMPRITFIADLKRNNARKAVEKVEALAKQIKEAISAEENSDVKIELLKQGLYEITLVLDAAQAESIGLDEVKIQFGVNKDGMFIISNDKTSGIKQTNAGTDFEKNVKGAINSIGTMFIDFNEVHAYAEQLSTVGAQIDESMLTVLNELNLLTFRAYAGVDSVKLDFNLSYEIGETVQTLFESVGNQLPY